MKYVAPYLLRPLIWPELGRLFARRVSIRLSGKRTDLAAKEAARREAEAWEAMRLKRPVLIIGASPYCAIGQGFVHCPGPSDLPSAVTRALSIVPATDERLELYLAALLDLPFEFPTELFWGNVTAETVRRNPRIATAIADRLLEIVRLTRAQGSDTLRRVERDQTSAG